MSQPCLYFAIAKYNSLNPGKYTDGKKIFLTRHWFVQGTQDELEEEDPGDENLQGSLFKILGTQIAQVVDGFDSLSAAAKIHVHISNFDEAEL